MYSSPAIKRVSLSNEGTAPDSTGSKLDDASVETLPLRKHSRIDNMSMIMERPPAFNSGSTLTLGASLKLENSQLKIQLERLQLQLSNERAQHERVAIALEELEKDRTFLLNCDNKTKNELQEAKTQQKEEFEVMKSQLMTARNEISHLNDSLFEQKNILRERELSIQKVQQQLLRTQSALSDKGRASAALVEQQQKTIQELEAKLSKASEAQKEAQPQKHGTPLSSNKKVADLESQLRRLMYENGVLRDAAAHGKLMAEKLREAEQQLEAHRETEKRLYEVEAQLHLLERQSSSQFGAADANALTTKDIRDLMEKSMSIPSLQERISHLNAENLHLRNEIALLTGRIDALVSESKSLQDQLNTQSKQLAESHLLESSHRAEIASLKEQIAALEKIEESSQSLLDSLRKKPQPAEQISSIQIGN